MKPRHLKDKNYSKTQEHIQTIVKKNPKKLYKKPKPKTNVACKHGI